MRDPRTRRTSLVSRSARSTRRALKLVSAGRPSSESGFDTAMMSNVETRIDPKSSGNHPLRYLAPILFGSSTHRVLDEPACGGTMITNCSTRSMRNKKSTRRFNTKRVSTLLDRMKPTSYGVTIAVNIRAVDVIMSRLASSCNVAAKWCIAPLTQLRFPELRVELSEAHVGLSARASVVAMPTLQPKIAHEPHTDSCQKPNS
eukprot:370597-Prymnesium_polylepis.1